jgi:hypothetical protein
MFLATYMSSRHFRSASLTNSGSCTCASLGLCNFIIPKLQVAWYLQLYYLDDLLMAPGSRDGELISKADIEGK